MVEICSWWLASVAILESLIAFYRYKENWIEYW